MEIILRIYFIGLIAFVPSQDGSETTVIIERARDGHKTTDGHHVEPHLPLLLARGHCEGDCQPNRERIASFLYDLPQEPNTRASMRQMDATLNSGGAWILDDVKLSIGFPSPPGEKQLTLSYGPPRSRTDRMPGNRTEARSFDWIARMRHVAPEAAIIDPRALAGDPSYGLVAARMIVDQGTLSTYSLVEAENQIASIGFQPMSAAHPTAGSRAYADWVALDIPLTQEACSQGVTITARPMGVGRTRTMTLKPACSPSDSAQPSVTEIAIVNLPSWQAARRATTRYPSPLGPHFELYYKLAKTIPEPARRLVPALAADAAGVAPKTIDLERAASPLLQGLQLTDAKGTFAQPICIPVAFEAPADDG